MKDVKVLIIGDIVGRPGRYCLRDLLPKIQENYEIDFTIANGENAAAGKGITKKAMNSLLESGVDLITSGNHIWDKKEIFKFIDEERSIIRPANFPPGNPGNGHQIIETNSVNIGVINLSGRVFMSSIDCPFQKGKEIIDKITHDCNIIIIDFHAEATSEKMALARYFDGKVSAIIGTHTHIQTADEQVLPAGTGYITDVGMTGPYESILGVESQAVIDNFITGIPTKFEVAEGKVQFNGVVVHLDSDNGICKKIERIQDLHEF
ncbi:TIGR00282 family metallophosphoesterase [Natranaerobius thermophilus]|uniref:Metallophosphoesterase n=1 Tax=Natranaerobius thermophilus (strain ATCC BAA-1301 / DSM 18059 / JW/NM-WN-LF) TaxID=457570 RepID=B2A3V7_NATTJ|nr:TIGR00282 family metallophosphoesterase [Natranaerobius thermophilus]ACB85059.1 metallophosphoesterase [Natranaerobius thermophilus JW/NM-WN-LF]